VVYVMPSTLWPSTEEPAERKALITAYTAAKFYRDDVMTMVLKEAKKSIAEQKSSDDAMEIAAGRKRSKALKEWIARDHPLKGDAYTTIARIIDADAIKIPEASQMNLQRGDFVKEMVSTGRKSKVNGWHFISGGYFQHILPIALELIDKYAALLQRKKDEFAMNVFMKAFLGLHVSLVPGPPPSSGNVGAPMTLPRWNTWSTFAGSGSDLLRQPSDARQRQSVILQQNQDEVIANDEDAEWFACGITLQDIGTVFKRTQRPADFLTPEQIDDKPGYIQDTYRWVYDSLDFSKPLHTFALIMALVTINHVPAMFINIPDRYRDSDVGDIEKTKRFVQGFTWYDKTDSKRGTKQKDIFLTMVVTIIIALYEEDSPLRKYAQKHKKLGDAFTKKHGRTSTLSCMYL
jgi:hypothetical protein